MFKYLAVIDSGTMRRSSDGEIYATYHTKILYKTKLPIAVADDNAPLLELPKPFLNGLSTRLETHHAQIPASQRVLFNWKVSWL